MARGSRRLQIVAAQQAAGVRLAANPLVLVLEHAGMPEAARSAIADAGARMRRRADHPNLHTKPSGLGAFTRRNDPAHIADVVAETVELFGSERCAWDSSFPVEKIWADCSSILDASTRQSAISEIPAAYHPQ